MSNRTRSGIVSAVISPKAFDAKELREAHQRAVAHAERLKKFSPPTEDEIQSMIERFMSQKRVTLCPAAGVGYDSHAWMAYAKKTRQEY